MDEMDPICHLASQQVLLNFCFPNDPKVAVSVSLSVPQPLIACWDWALRPARLRWSADHFPTFSSILDQAR